MTEFTHTRLSRLASVQISLGPSGSSSSVILSAHHSWRTSTWVLVELDPTLSSLERIPQQKSAVSPAPLFVSCISCTTAPCSIRCLFIWDYHKSKALEGMCVWINWAYSKGTSPADILIAECLTAYRLCSPHLISTKYRIITWMWCLRIWGDISIKSLIIFRIIFIDHRKRICGLCMDSPTQFNICSVLFGCTIYLITLIICP